MGYDGHLSELATAVRHTSWQPDSGCRTAISSSDAIVWLFDFQICVLEASLKDCKDDLNDGREEVVEVEEDDRSLTTSLPLSLLLVLFEASSCFVRHDGDIASVVVVVDGWRGDGDAVVAALWFVSRRHELGAQLLRWC